MATKEFTIPPRLDEFVVPEPEGDNVKIIPEEDVLYRPADPARLNRIRTEP